MAGALCTVGDKAVSPGRISREREEMTPEREGESGGITKEKENLNSDGGGRGEIPHCLWPLARLSAESQCVESGTRRDSLNPCPPSFLLHVSDRMKTP